VICDWAMLCHDIEAHAASGGLSIIGVFVRLLVDRLPGTIHPPLSIAVRLSGIAGESGECVVAVHDPHGKILKELPPQTIAMRPPSVDFSASLAPISIREIGDHYVTVSINGAELRRVVMPVNILKVM